MKKVGEQVLLIFPFTCPAHKTNKHSVTPPFPTGGARRGWGVDLLHHTLGEGEEAGQALPKQGYQG